MSKSMVLLVAALLLLAAYVLHRPTHLSFSADVTINHVDLDDVLQFVSNPALIASAHGYHSVVTAEERDAEGRTVGTIRETITFSVFGLIRLPSYTFPVRYILATRGNEVHYQTTMPYIDASQTYSLSLQGDAVHVIHQFNATCAWVFSSITLWHVRKSHTDLLLNMKSRLEGSKL